MHVNLLPTTFVLKCLVRRRLRQWAVVIGAMGVGMIVWNADQFHSWIVSRREFQVIHADAEPIRNLQMQRIELTRASNLLNEKIKRVSSVVAPDRSLSILGIIAAGVGAADGAIQIQDAQISVVTVAPTQNAKTISSKAIESQDQSSIQLMLRGIAGKSDAISSFMEQLQATQVFPKIELRSSRERMISNQSVQEFQLECSSHE
jgi:hypothetical protein